MSPERPYYVMGPALGSVQVQAWSGYPLQFGGQRRFGWQDQMAADLRAALARLAVAVGDVLAGEYLFNRHIALRRGEPAVHQPRSFLLPQRCQLDPVRTRRGSAAATARASRQHRGAFVLLPLPPGRDMAMVGTRRAAGALAPRDAPTPR